MRTDEERYWDAVQDLAEIYCPSCKEYKGMSWCEPCDVSYCVFCDDHTSCEEEYEREMQERQEADWAEEMRDRARLGDDWYA